MIAKSEHQQYNIFHVEYFYTGGCVLLERALLKSENEFFCNATFCWVHEKVIVC
jgi:hypothetical protein